MEVLKLIINSFKMKSKIPLVDNVHYELFDKDGNRKSFYQHNVVGRFILKTFGIDLKSALFGKNDYSMDVSNLITNAGFALVAARLISDSTEALVNYIAVGTGTTAADVTDTTLETELAASGLSRAVATLSRVTTDVANDTAQFVKEFTVTGSAAVTESGLLNAASAGTLVARQVFSAINVSSGDTLQITWKLDID